MRILHERGVDLPEDPHERISIDSSNGHLRVMVPVRREGYRVLIDSLWLAILAAFEVALILLLVGRAPPELTPGVLTKSAIALLLGFGAVGGLLLIWRILWMAWGQEEFSTDNECLLLRRGIGRLTISTKRFPLSRVRNFRVGPLRYHLFYPSWGRPFVNHEEHQVFFDVDRWTYHVARGLTRSEAEYLATLLRESLEAKEPLRRAS